MIGFVLKSLKGSFLSHSLIGGTLCRVIEQARIKHKTAVSLENLYPYVNFECSNFFQLFKEVEILPLELSIMKF
jgi:hypothetical protein